MFITSPTHPTGLQGMQRMVTAAFEHTSFRRRKEEKTYKMTGSSEGKHGNQGSQIQRIGCFYMCTKVTRQFTLNNVS